MKSNSGDRSFNFSLNNYFLGFSKIFSHKVVLGPTKYVFHFLGSWSWDPLTKTLKVKSSANLTKMDLSESTPRIPFNIKEKNNRP